MSSMSHLGCCAAVIQSTCPSRVFMCSISHACGMWHVVVKAIMIHIPSDERTDAPPLEAAHRRVVVVRRALSGTAAITAAARRRRRRMLSRLQQGKGRGRKRSGGRHGDDLLLLRWC